VHQIKIVIFETVQELQSFAGKKLAAKNAKTREKKTLGVPWCLRAPFFGGKARKFAEVDTRKTASNLKKNILHRANLRGCGEF